MWDDSLPSHIFDESELDHLFLVETFGDAVLFGFCEDDFEIAQVFEHHWDGRIVK